MFVVQKVPGIPAVRVVAQNLFQRNRTNRLVFCGEGAGVESMGSQVTGKVMTLKFRAVFLGIVSFVLGILFLISSVSAQGPFDKFKEGLEDLRPKGVLLRKIFGDKEDDKNANKSADTNQPAVQGNQQQPNQADPRIAAEMQRRAALAQQQRQQSLKRQQPTLPSRMQQPTLAPQQTASSQRYPVGQHSNALPSNTRNADYGLTPPPLPPQPNNVSGGNRPAIMVATPVVEPHAPQVSGDAIDLGINIRVLGKGDQAKGLLVEKIDERGLGARSGLRKGDLIVGIGGIGVVSEDEFNSIASVMRAGDQIEFEINRKGKSQKLQVQFGDAPDSGPDLEFDPSSDQGAAGGSIGDLNMDLSQSAPVDHIASVWSRSDSQDSSANPGMLKSVLVHDPWPNDSATRNRR